jgi:hypothetical protein
MPSNRNKENQVKCPVEGCDAEPMKRGLYLHIFQTDDPEGEGHGPRHTFPDWIDLDEITVTREKDVTINYPDTQNLDTDTKYLDTYTGKVYNGKRGLMIHFGQIAGKNNIPENITEIHSPDDFPIVEVDDNGNITKVIKEPKNNVPPIEPYLPWTHNEMDGYIPKHRVRAFVEDLREDGWEEIAMEVEHELLK